MSAPLHVPPRDAPSGSDELGASAAERVRLMHRLESTVRGAAIGLWELDFVSERTSWFNDWCERLSLDPCEARDPLGRWGGRIHPEDHPEAARRLGNHFAGTEDRYDAEYRIRDRNGRWRWVFERARVVERTAEGAPLRMVGVCMEIDARKEAELGLREVLRRSERQGLEREIIEIANREQQRIGSDLHDGLGQDLTGIALMLRGIGAQLRKEGSAACLDIEDVISLVNSAIESTRALARGLSPVSAERDGLAAALQALAARATERYGIPVGFESYAEQPLPLDETSATHLYRIAQEALTNAMRHSLASAVAIRLAANGGSLQLEVTDDGRGFADGLRDGSDGLGLKIMRYRAQILGGDLTLERGPVGGTTVRCTCSLAPAEVSASARSEP